MPSAGSSRVSAVFMLSVAYASSCLYKDSPAQVFWHFAIVFIDQIPYTASACILSHYIQEPLRSMQKV